jgi:hypothetical protein
LSARQNGFRATLIPKPSGAKMLAHKDSYF